MEETRSFAPLLLVAVLAFGVPLALSRFRRLRLPIVVGEILAGIAVGRSGLGWVPPHDPVLELLSEFGFVFLMFLSGMEIDFSQVGLPGRAAGTASSRRRTWGPLPLGGLSFALTLLLAAGVGLALQQLGLVRNAWMMALVLSTTSLGVVMPVLKERGLTAGPFGQALLIAALVADFSTMLLITVLVAILSSGLTLDILLIGVLFVVFFLFYHFGQLSFNRIPGLRRGMQELSHASAQIKVRAAFTLMLIFVVLSEALGTEVILGAFLAGAIVSLLRTPDDADLSHKLEAIGFGFFIPIFFIHVGINFNLDALLASPQAVLLVPVLLLAAIALKFLPALVFRLSFTWRETLAAGALLSARLSLIIAASAIGVRLGVISDSVNAAIILVAILTVTGAPLLFVRLAPEAGPGRPQPIVIAGANELGLQLATHLRAHNELVLILDEDEGRVARARKQGFEASAVPLTTPNSELARHYSQARALVCTLADAERAYQVCHLARTTYGLDHVVSQVSQPADIGRFEQIGTVATNAALDLPVLLGLLVRNPAMYALLTRTEDDKEIYEVTVHDHSVFVGQRLHQLRLPGDVLVSAVQRNGDLLVPHGNTQLAGGDRLTLVGSLDFIELARQMFANSRAP